MNEKFLQQMKENLLTQKKELVSKSARVVDIDTDGDETDEIQANMILELAGQLSDRNLEKIGQIDEALKKISNKDYGLCEDCGEEISEKRLNINPYFLTCILCAEEREAEIRQKGRY